ncbi:MAG: hypothetical protein WAQ05_12310 [Rubrivivax sp.]
MTNMPSVSVCAPVLRPDSKAVTCSQAVAETSWATRLSSTSTW